MHCVVACCCSFKPWRKGKPGRASDTGVVDAQTGSGLTGTMGSPEAAALRGTTPRTPRTPANNLVSNSASMVQLPQQKEITLRPSLVAAQKAAEQAAEAAAAELRPQRKAEQVKPRALQLHTVPWTCGAAIWLVTDHSRLQQPELGRIWDSVAILAAIRESPFMVTIFRFFRQGVLKPAKEAISEQLLGLGVMLGTRLCVADAARMLMTSALLMTNAAVIAALIIHANIPITAAIGYTVIIDIILAGAHSCHLCCLGAALLLPVLSAGPIAAVNLSVDLCLCNDSMEQLLHTTLLNDELA